MDYIYIYIYIYLLYLITSLVRSQRYGVSRRKHDGHTTHDTNNEQLGHGGLPTPGGD